MASDHELVLILDFGGQYTQLIARRVRELGVYSEIVPFNTTAEDIRRRNPRGIILSGGPSSVYEEGAPHPDPAVIQMDYRLAELENATRNHGVTLGEVAARATDVPELRRSSLVMRAQSYRRRMFQEFERVKDLLLP